MTEPKRMGLDAADVWLRELQHDLVDANYRVDADADSHLKLEALQVVMKRWGELEEGLTSINAIRCDLDRKIGRLL